VSDLDEFRAAKDEFFALDHRSPLTDEQKAEFEGLAYFPEESSLRLVAPIDVDVDHDEVRMQTSTGDEQVYRRAGIVRFEVDGEPAQITLYASEHQHGFFVPFRDATSGKETYGAGRYLEAEVLDDGRVEVDFNLAYNPYCAYNERWSCPLPPIENWLKVPIRAGERSFPGHVVGADGPPG
jgi:hypothetical protein